MALRLSPDPTAPAPRSPGGRRLGLYALGAGVAATAAVVLGVLPAEYGVDPTGFGRATGLLELYAPTGPAEVAVETQTTAPVEIATLPDTPFRTDTVTITVGGMQQNWGQVEYKLSLLAGDDVVYSWQASGPLYYEFHGHTISENGEPMQVMDYLKGESDTSQGRLTAPLDGIHGWFFRNDAFTPVDVEFTFAGFYKLEPGIIEFQRVDPPEATEEDAVDAEAALLEALPQEEGAVRN